MAVLTTLNITEKNANNSLSVTAKVNVTKEGVFTTTLSKEDEFYEGIENEEKAKEKSREWYLNWINYMREQIK